MIVGTLGAWLGGCASMNETEDRTEESEDRSRVAPQREGGDVARPDESIRTIQLYREGDERQLPITRLRGGANLILEFDLLKQEGRPLSVYFFHADRTWSRDLLPNESFETYNSDQLLDYHPSQGTEVEYNHYEYTFPNDDIQFRVSGNYVLRVTERGDRNEVLFERRFFVTEQRGALNTQLEPIQTAGSHPSAIRPIAQFDPPTEVRGSPNSFAACFVREGALGDVRCEDRPQLMGQPRLRFELERAQAFDGRTEGYVVDISQFRTGESIDRLDQSVSPPVIELDPDYAQFSEIPHRPLLNGQIVVEGAVRNRTDPSMTAEYARVRFVFVPPSESPFSVPVRLAGSFTGMSSEHGYEMEWTSRQRYETEVLLKQGQYQYFYALPAGSEASVQDDRTTRRLGRGRFTTFLYYRDPSRNTDRLLQVGESAP